MGRKKNATLNVASRLFIKIFEMILRFVCRIVFIRMLGKEYLGISSLFESILDILAISELGIESAVVYSLYKPLAFRDEDKIRTLIAFYRKACIIIGSVILGLGLLVMPFIPYIVGDKTSLVNVNLIYLLYLFQTVISYWFFSYRIVIVDADQKTYILTKIRSMTVFLLAIFQMIVLFVFKNYVVYLLVSIFFTITSSFLSAKKVYEVYPFLKNRSSNKLSKAEFVKIKKDIVGLFCYKISSAVLNSTDNVIISAWVNVASVGMFDNYKVISKYITTFMFIIFGSYESSVGNLFVTESKEKTNEVFYNMNFVNFWVYGFCTVAYYVLINPFISIVFGKEYLLSHSFVLIMFLLLAFQGLSQTVYTFSDGCGLFWEGRFRAVFYAILNIVLSILLVKKYSIEGVVLATLLTHIVFSGWYDPYLLFKYKLKTPMKKFFCRYVFYMVLTVTMAFVMEFLCNLIFKSVSIGSLFGRFGVCLVIPNMVYYFIFRKSEEFIYFKELFASFINKIKRK